MRRSLLSRTMFVGVVILISTYALIGVPRSREDLAANWRRNIRLGTDLQGGLHLVAQVAWREAWDAAGAPTAEFRERVMTQTRDVMLRKINALGLAEATVQPLKEDELLIELPGVDDPERVEKILSTAAVLEWLDVKDGPFATQAEGYAKNGGLLPVSSKLLQAPTGAWYLTAKNPVIRGTDLRDAQARQTAERGWVTTFVLSQEAAKRFETYTATHIGKYSAIVLDGRVLSVPIIESRIGDTGEIAGARTREDASDLALNLRTGSLPARVAYLDHATVGPALGADSIHQGFRAGAAGLAAVVAAMTAYYKRSGFHASLALVLNALVLLAALSWFGAVLTLPGIAGLILTIGMAVDSNVLIFERIREELRAGKSAAAAVDAGFRRSWVTILDTHATTFIACGCLFFFGATAVRGFAITLTIGMLANLFTAVFVSRLWFDWELYYGGASSRLSI